jgi:hypothetical protein
VPDCRLCGADIRWVLVKGGDRIAIDAHTTHMSGEGRFMEVEPGSSLVEPVSETANVAAPKDHKYTCPYGLLDVGGRGESASKSRARSEGGATTGPQVE